MYKIKSQIHMCISLLRVEGILKAYQARYRVVRMNKEHA